MQTTIPSFITPEMLNEKFNTNLTSHVGIEYTEVGPDYISGKMPVDQRTMQPMGLLHGGASVVLAESLGSLGANCLVDQEKYACVGLEINANHVKAVSEGFVYGKAAAIHIGRKTQVWDIRIANEQDETICISRLTVAIIEKKNG